MATYMNPSVIMYIGILVAMFILVWGVSLLYQRYASIYQRKKADVKAMQTWVPLHPDPPNPTAEDVTAADDPQEDTSVYLRAKAQQNGHYSESKHTL
jgi:hypothetical protein